MLGCIKRVAPLFFQEVLFIGKPNKDIAVIGCYTQDRITGRNGSVSVRKGGPAYFMGNALKELGESYELISSSNAVAEIELGQEMERVRMVTAEKIDIPKQINSKAVIVSPVLDEVDLNELNGYRGIVCVDVQGFTRVRGKAEKKVWIEAGAFVDRINVMKVSEIERKFVPEEVLEKMKQKVLLVTRGKKGSELYWKGEKYSIESRVVDDVDETGAGDVFLAAFVSEYLKGNDAEKAGKFAADYVSGFLQRKKTGAS